MAVKDFICIDTETTGLNFKTDLVISVGIAVFLRGECVHKTSFFVKNDAVPNGGFHVNQITDEQIANGYDPEWAFSLVSSIMHKVPRVIVAYNAPFDLTMLAGEFRRHAIVYDYSRMKIIDPLVIERHYHGPWQNKLINAASRYRIPYEDYHEAGADAATAGHVYMAQQMRYPLRRMGFGYLHSRQQVWHEKWRTDLLDYYRARGASLPEITPWPYDPEIEYNLDGEQSLLW
jgi:DNA polymerase III subunit epsilon